MLEAEKGRNPFASAKTPEEREQVWKSLMKIAKPISKEEGERLLNEAIRLQKLEMK